MQPHRQCRLMAEQVLDHPVPAPPKRQALALPSSLQQQVWGWGGWQGGSVAERGARALPQRDAAVVVYVEGPAVSVLLRVCACVKDGYMPQRHLGKEIFSLKVVHPPPHCLFVGIMSCWLCFCLRVSVSPVPVPPIQVAGPRPGSCASVHAIMQSLSALAQQARRTPRPPLSPRLSAVHITDTIKLQHKRPSVNQRGQELLPDKQRIESCPEAAH